MIRSNRTLSRYTTKVTKIAIHTANNEDIKLSRRGNITSASGAEPYRVDEMDIGIIYGTITSAI